MLAIPFVRAAWGAVPARGRPALVAAHAGTRAAVAAPVPVGSREDPEVGFATETGSTETVERWMAKDLVPKWELGVGA